MTTQTRETLLSRDTFPTEVVEFPGRPDSIVRTMSALERATYEAKAFATGQVDMRTFKLLVCVACLVGEDGKRLLTDEEAEVFGDAKLPAYVEAVFNAAAKLNGIGQANVDDAEKTSAATDDAGTASN